MANNQMKKCGNQEKLRHAARRQMDRSQRISDRDTGAEGSELHGPHSDNPFGLDVDSLQIDFATLMRKAHIPGELIYAYLRTGLLVTEENYEYLAPEDRLAWDGAINEFAYRLRGMK